MLNRLEFVLKQLTKCNMKLKLSKCRFSQRHVNYLGHTNSARVIAPDADKIRAIVELSVPKNAKEVKSFLGLPSYYRRFKPKCSELSAPLTKLLKKGVTFQLGTEQQNAFEKLKQTLVDAPILRYPDFTKPFIVQTDASYLGIGAVLSQLDEEGRDHPIAYASRSLRPAEKNYAVTELETLAVVYFVQHFKPYLFQQKVTIQTDHTAVKAILTKENPNQRMLRWGLALSGYQLDIQPRKGITHQNADVLSRNPLKIDNEFNNIEKLQLRPEIAVNAELEDERPEEDDLTVFREFQQAEEELKEIFKTQTTELNHPNYTLQEGLI